MSANQPGKLYVHHPGRQCPECEGILEDMSGALPFARSISAGRALLLVKLHWCAPQNELLWFLACGTDDQISIHRQGWSDHSSFDGQDLLYILALYREYFQRNILAINSTLGTFEMERRQAFLSLSRFFAAPLGPFLSLDTHLLVQAVFSLGIDRTVINYGELINLRYRYGLNTAHEDIVVTDVFGSGMRSILKRMSDITPPSYVDIALCVAMDLDIKQNGPARDGMDIRRQRDVILNEAMIAARVRGTTVYPAFTWPDLQRFFLSKEQTVLQIFAHFHYNRITLDRGTIRMDALLRWLRSEGEQGTLNSCFIIQALMCTNHEAMAKLYACEEIKLVHMSHVDLDAIHISYMLYELYAGKNAQRLGLNADYLDGRTYLHHAWARIQRTFYTLAYHNQTVNA